jgi:phosphoglycerate dehydrogenase-like enzyme
MPSNINVHFIDKPKQDFQKIFQALADKTIRGSYGKKIPNPEKIHYLVTSRPTQDMLTVCSNLQGIIIPFTGLPLETREVMIGYPHISVHNLHHNALPAAEHAFALLLASAKHLLPYDRALRDHDWRPRYGNNSSVLLWGKTALILGYGHIGSRLARMLKGLEMSIMATRNNIISQDEDGIAKIYPKDELHTLLPKANILINTLPLTPLTENLIGANELSLLPSGAVLVNVGRGKVINQDALYRSLKNGHVGAVGIDVWYNYPSSEASRANTPPADFPFHKLDNVVMSPHRAGGLNSPENERLRMTHLANLLNHAARGEPLPNRVDLSKGY